MAQRLLYHVAPRYTPGSPAQVDESTAERVAKDENQGFLRCLEGVYGVENVDRAGSLGLDGIVYCTMEISGRVHVGDMITSERYVVPGKQWEGKPWHLLSGKDRSAWIVRYNSIATKNDSTQVVTRTPPGVAYSDLVKAEHVAKAVAHLNNALQVLLGWENIASTPTFPHGPQQTELRKSIDRLVRDAREELNRTGMLPL